MNGNWGRVLMVDLDRSEAQPYLPPWEWYRDYLGGEGLAVRLLHEFVHPERDALDPTQPIILAAGPLSGTAAPSSGRGVLVFRSPLGGALGAANGGGYFAWTLKQAGWDAIVVTGRADAPVFLAVDEEGGTLHDATGLWGMTPTDTDEAVKAAMAERAGGRAVQVACIGPGSERMVRFGNVMTDKYRSYGRGGGGAVMGSKNLKAMAVWGSRPVPLADPERFAHEAAEAKKELLSDPFVAETMRKYGTSAYFDAISNAGVLPTRNWKRGQFAEALPQLGSRAYHEILDVKSYACGGCYIGCGRLSRYRGETPYGDLHGGGPEYESLAGFGAKCLVNDIIAVTAANHIANDFGIDVCSTAQAIATAIEWYEQGIITDKDTGGLALAWGDGPTMVEMVKKIGRREDIGDLLAEGVMRAAAALGPAAEAAAMHVKGVEMPSDGVQGGKSMAIVQATSARGGDHLRPYTSSVDSFGARAAELGLVGEYDPLEDGNKAWVKPFQEYSLATNMMGVCMFPMIAFATKPSTWARLVSAAVGVEFTKDDLLRTAERVINLERLVNARLGFDRKDDTLPKRFLDEPIEDGPGKGQVVDLDAVLDSYYTAMGWDLDTGLPTAAKLRELGLDWLA